MIWYSVIGSLSENTFRKKRIAYFYIDCLIFLSQAHGAGNSLPFIEVSNPLKESTDLKINTFSKVKK